jgi:EAL domain-containing protein (putative c-di-GMP-specific phosphodiesterase class I)
VLTFAEPTFTLQGNPFLVYLPVVDLQTGRLLGMEALVRWRHPTRGDIAPELLIKAAETSNDLGPLTGWILMAACAEAVMWSPSIQLGVNCSVAQVRSGHVAQAVAEALEQTLLPSDRLNIEVTEDAVADPVASPDLHALSDLGVQLSVDDVGTNWSSFEPFRRNSISTVKIDGSFTSGLEAQQGINRLVVETVTHMAHSLGMSAIIEKVESAEQAEIAKVFHVDAAQGYFFSEPLPQGQARILASLPEVPVFSRTEERTLVLQDGTTVPLSEALAAAETGPIGVAVPVPEAADA